MRAYHFLCEDFTSPNKPKQVWEVGQTRKLRGKEIVPCKYGYHASPTLWDALQYSPGPVACLVELDDATLVPHGNPVDKYAARSRTLLAAVDVERELRLFAADCAEHVLWIYERDYPNDSRPRDAIQAARDYAAGRIDAAALDAARVDAWTARVDAWTAWAAAALAAAWVAALAAARVAARAAAGAAPGAAARAAEEAWQRQQFDQRFTGLFSEVAS